MSSQEFNLNESFENKLQIIEDQFQADNDLGKQQNNSQGNAYTLLLYNYIIFIVLHFIYLIQLFIIIYFIYCFSKCLI